VALYAFDGTWEKERAGAERETNVARFADAYRGRVCHHRGAATRFGGTGRIAGGITGHGGRARIERAMDGLLRSFDREDTEIDIVGSGRGAALALSFANEVAFYAATDRIDLPIRFLGLWDTVPALDFPDTAAGREWTLDVADTVGHAFHAMALDERRKRFTLRRPDVPHTGDRRTLQEVWFRGVHSDVAGGNGKSKLSSIALHWMFANALRLGLPLDSRAIARNRRRRVPHAAISTSRYDGIRDPCRPVRPWDAVHVSVRFRPDVGRRRHNNPPSGVRVVDDAGRVARRFVTPQVVRP
jgi:uncharacterized protein (DUF2235 family)